MLPIVLLAATAIAALEVPENLPIPGISARAFSDSPTSWNVVAEVEAFAFTPSRLGGEAVPGTGYGLLLLDGEPVARMYGRAFHLGSLEPGPHTVQIGLYSDTGAPWQYRAWPISATVAIEVPARSAYPEAHDKAASDEPDAGETRVTRSEDVPRVVLDVQRDPLSGWNVLALISGFEMAPEKAGHEAVEGQGHGRLYLDGAFVARLYSDAFHLPDLAPGTHKVRVELHGNDYSALTHRGQRIGAEAVFVVE